MQIDMVAAGDDQVASVAQLQILLGVAEEAADVTLLQVAHLHLHLLWVAQLQLLTERPTLVTHLWLLPYLIIVTGTMGGARVKIFCQV